MNNSWGCPQVGELCAPNVMKTIVENSEAEGIFVNSSAGNNGSACSTVSDPPGIYESTFSTGAISGTTNALQGFSSRGPVSADGSFRMKPDISAPGAAVRSSLRNNDTAYGNMSGTSMASPHVVGTVALLWSARPSLSRDIARTKWLLTRSANPAVTVGANAAGCGGIAGIPNNHFGWRRLDALAAYNLEPSLHQTITFEPIADRVVPMDDFTLNATASSGLPVSYSASGSCSVTGNVVHATGVGPCTITASQEGLDVYGSRPPRRSRGSRPPTSRGPSRSSTRSPAFLRPVDNGETNLAQAGSAVPVKFSLGGDRGLAIFASDNPASRPMSCVTGQSLDPVEEVDAPGQSGLSYSAGADEYHYVWKTEKAWAGTCRRLSVTLVDGTVHTATFQFKK
jgi:hypothetical protein